MKTANIFWGALLISCGLLWLNNEFDFMSLNTAWTMQYWPVLIIIIGISVLINSKIIKVLAALISALFLSLLIYHKLDELPKSIDDIKIKIEKKVDEGEDFWNGI